MLGVSDKLFIIKSIQGRNRHPRKVILFENFSSFHGGVYSDFDLSLVYTPKPTHRYINSQMQHSTNRETEPTIIEYGTWRYLIRTRGVAMQNITHTHPPQDELPAPPSMMTYVHAAMEEYDTPSRITTMAQKLNYCCRTSYTGPDTIPRKEPTSHTPQEITKKGNTGIRATCIHTHCYWTDRLPAQANEIS